MTRMFPEVTRTFNPVVGCLHGCSYCWARDLAEGRLKHLPRYQDGFKPKLVEEELDRKFHKGVIFVTAMGDLWGDWVPREWIEQVLETIRRSPFATFLFLTKNPLRYYDFRHVMPTNVILGATIETNLPGGCSPAPNRLLRVGWMAQDLGSPTMVSIEPILRFSLLPFVSCIRAIRPNFVYIGYDNHGHHLPEPTLAETQALIQELQKFTQVRVKTLRERWNHEI